MRYWSNISGKAISEIGNEYDSSVPNYHSNYIWHANAIAVRSF